MTELSREERHKILKQITELADQITLSTAPMVMKHGPAEAMLALILASKQMESMFKMSFPQAEEGLKIMHQLADDLNEVNMQIYKEDLRDTPLGKHISKLMEKVGIKDKL